MKEETSNFILILANTGMRFGKARRIKWNFVQITKPSPSNDGRTSYPNVHIRIPAELSKVKKDRTAIGMRGDILSASKPTASISIHMILSLQILIRARR